MNENSNRLFSPYYCGDKFECYNHVTSLSPGKCVSSLAISVSKSNRCERVYDGKSDDKAIYV